MHYTIYSKLYGESNITVIPFELLKVAPDIFFESIHNLFNGYISKKEIESVFRFKERVCRSNLEFQLHRFLNNYEIAKTTYNILKVFDPIVPYSNKNSFWNKKTYQAVHQTYSEGNSLLNKKINFNLKDLGYPLLN